MSMNVPQEQIAQMRDQLRIITFVHHQKQFMMNANTDLVSAISASRNDLTTIFPSSVIDAYLLTLNVQNNQLAWECENLERDMEKITDILAQIDSPIHRVTAMPMPVPPGPRNIR